jgi:protocatechuate 3,4-dioxygenase beta subunit
MKNMYLIISFLSFLFCNCQQATPSKTILTTNNDTFNIPPKIKMITEGEPGEPIIIQGRVFLPDAKTPAKGAILSVWHTDTKGFYITGGGGAGELHPRIHGRMKTGADDKYEFHTIRPAQYPSHTSPAHVHGHISAPGFPEYPIIYYFEGEI